MSQYRDLFHEFVCPGLEQVLKTHDLGTVCLITEQVSRVCMSGLRTGSKNPQP